MKVRRILALLVALLMLSGSALAQAPRPGATPPPKTNVLVISTAAKYIFPNPMGTALAAFQNTTEAKFPVVYTLQISVEQLLKQLGISGYSAEEYAQLQQSEGFDPASSYIVLCQTEPIAPGQTVESITLGTLPDGTTLPAGDYEAKLFETVLDDDEQADSQSGEIPDSVTLSVSMTLSASMEIPFTVQESTITAQANGDGTIPLRVFNPVTSTDQAIYSIQLSQAEVERVTGSAHRTAEELAAQGANADFNAEYEFISLSESEPIAPGEFLESATLAALPDGSALAKGAYNAWLVKYTVDATGAKTMAPVNTAIALIIP